MSDKINSGSTDTPMVNWVTFSKKQAILKRLIDDNGNPGLILRVADTPDGEIVAKKAEESGFKKRAVGGFFTMVFTRNAETGRLEPELKVTDIAAMVGGEIVRIDRDRLKSKEMIINLYKRAKKPETGNSVADIEKGTEIKPDPDSFEILGLNMRGEEVIRDNSGRYFRKIIEDDGTHNYVHEEEGGQPTLFLRARRKEDLNGIAAGIMRMARKGTIHQKDFDRILDAALEEGPSGKLEMTREEAFDHLREQILRQTTAIALENGGDRPSFFSSLRVAANTGFVISRQTGTNEDLRPGAGLLSLIRRLSRGHDRVDFKGDPDLSVALPKIISDTAALQVHDFSEVPHNGISDYATNVLSRRPEEGASTFIVSADIDSDVLDRIRGEISRNYGVEAVARIAPGVADGVRDGRSVMIFFVGDRRPEPLDAVPQAALRTFDVSTQDDLVTLEREVLRSRAKIRDFNKGEVEANTISDDEREENLRQRPYQPLSRVGEPFTMIPRALEGATSKALQRVARDAEEFGGVDAQVARALGRSISELGDFLTPEQVDAVGLRLNAAERNRGFLEADQTGVGKGRTMAAMAYAHMREKEDHRCLYVTESSEINVPDVLRDMKAVGALEGFRMDGKKEVRFLMLTSGSRYISVSVDPMTGNAVEFEETSLKPKDRKQIFESGQWPEGYNLVLTTYSQFNVNDENPRAEWLKSIADENTMFVLDECHNALNPRSNTGRNFRDAIMRMPAKNVCFATGTPARNPQGMDLYSPLLPQGEGSNVAGILEHIASGGEVAQEAFATMLAEDGVMIRRDHDLSATDYQVHLPDDKKILEYQDTMNRFSPIVEGMIDVSTQIGEIVGRAQALHYRQMVNNGLDERQARAMTNELSQYSLSIGGPLANLSRIMMNAIKVDQVVEAAVAEMDQGRKPLITFHTTYEALMKEMVRDADGNTLSDDELAELPQMTIRDHIRRIHNSLYRMKIDGETLDPRENNSDVMRAFRKFAKSARNPMTSTQTVMMNASRMSDTIAMLDDEASRTRIDAEFNAIRASILGDHPNIAAVESLNELKKCSYYDMDETIAALDAFENDFRQATGESLTDDMHIQVTGLIDDLRLTQDPGVIRELVTQISDHARHIEVPRNMNAEIRAELNRFEGEVDDLGGDRAHYDAINDAYDRITALIETIPDLPVSPVDAIIERLEANNIRTGEISGRTWCYREDRIQKRSGRDRKETVDKFNGGELEALIYNSAGATGGSYHAGKTFDDQRPRTLIEFEAPLDVIKYVQAQGRGNRYDQVASPKVLSVVTGLTPEMRIFQQRNAKLRSLGASVDGNRSHPLLLDDIPDLLNQVGDEASRNVLLSAPALARRLGFPKFAEEDMLDVREVDGVNDRGSGIAKTGMESLANKVLARSIMLPANEQDDLIQRIRMEFDVLIEELESRNANPLRPKEFGGSVNIRTSTIFSGQELEEGDLDTSVFISPVYMSTGIHDMGEDPVAAERLVSMVERAITMHSSEGFKSYADRINQNLSGFLRHFLPDGYDMDAALQQPDEIPGRFNKEYHKITDLAWVLENLQPGVSVRFPSASDLDGERRRTIVDLVPPKDPMHYDMASAYKIKTICPGDSKPETIAVSRIMANKMEDIIFRPGISDGFNEAYLREFSEAAQLRRMLPVQILGGNILLAITVANQHDLGTISLYRDGEGQVHRGILVHDSKIDMTRLPVPIQSALVAAEVATQFTRSAGDHVRQDSSTLMRIWGSMEEGAKDPGARDLADIIIRVTGNSATIDMQPLRLANLDFYESRPGLYEAIHAQPMPDRVPERAWRKPNTKHKYLSTFNLDTPESRDRLYTIIELLSGVPMMTDGVHRDLVNETLEIINRDGPRGRETGEEGVEFFGDEENLDQNDVALDREADPDGQDWTGALDGVEI
ncbi:strawberry notch C-terminal domain-containing protein [Pseudosulfitobacter pseudonitzschiae]|uniref:strawberry notch C-terminal domain-containing protein n=1 Tax=Pseudosulfitobacter pseudonitzschiae TaxID=1402135 RepID=UPI003B783A16